MKSKRGNFRVVNWVKWWILVGIAIGVVMMAIILGHHLHGRNQDFALWGGVIYWFLGGLVCYACNGIHAAPEVEVLDKKPAPSEHPCPEADWQWHAPSDFLLPGSRKSLLPPRYR